MRLALLVPREGRVHAVVALGVWVAVVCVRLRLPWPEVEVIYLPLILYAFASVSVSFGWAVTALSVFTVFVFSAPGPKPWAALPLATSLTATALLSFVLQRERLRERKDLDTVTSVAVDVSPSLETRRVLQAVVQAAAKVLDAKGSSIRLLEPDGETLAVRATHGLSEAYLSKGPVVVKQSPTDRRALEGDAVAIFNAASDPSFQYPAEAEREGIASVLSVPLNLREKAIGVLRVYTAKPRHFTGREVRLLRALASHAALAIAHAQSHEQLLSHMRRVGHELRAPLGAIQSMIQVVLDGLTGEVPEKQRQLLERSSYRASVLLSLVSDLLTLARASVQVEERPRALVVIGHALRSVASAFQPLASEKEVEIALDVDVDLRPVAASEEDIETLLYNLVSNAVKYTPKGGKVALQARDRDGTVEIIVQDTGIGISKQDLPRIFDEFFRSANARELVESGTGLGMSIVKNIATRYGGSISLESELGVGTTVRLELPCEKGALPHEEQTDSNVSAS